MMDETILLNSGTTTCFRSIFDSHPSKKHLLFSENQSPLRERHIRTKSSLHNCTVGRLVWPGRSQQNAQKIWTFHYPTLCSYALHGYIRAVVTMRHRPSHINTNATTAPHAQPRHTRHFPYIIFTLFASCFIRLVPGAPSLGVKRPWHKANHHSPPSSAEVKNGGAIPPFPHRPSCRRA
jgi:hypothetical protein